MSVRTDVVNLMVNVGGNAAQNELNQLRKTAADLNAEMKGLHKNTNEYKKKAGELKVVETQMAGLRKQIGLAALNQKELTAELKRLQQLKNIVTPQTKEFFELQKQIDAVKNRLYDVKNGVFGFQSTLSKLGTHIKQFGLLAIGYLGFEFMTGAFKQIISGAGQLSDKLADVRRVTGLGQESVEHLLSTFRKFDTRTATSQLLDYAKIAGKLGLATDDIAGFVKATDMLVTSLGDELGDADAITENIGKIINIYDHGAKITGERTMQIGNAIIDLANKGVASGGFIVDFTKRLAGIANTANVGLEASIGLAAGLEELGQTSETSSTAVTQILTKLGADLPKYAKLAGKDLTDFANTLRNSPIEALLQLAEGLTKNKNGFAEIAVAFKDAEASGVRVTSTLGVLGQKSDFLRGKITDAGTALQKTDQITEAFRLKNETLGATLEKISKRLGSMFTTSTFMAVLKSTIGTFAELIGATHQAENALAKFKSQADKVNKLQSDIVPLLDRYDELKTKTNLSALEQVELNKAIAAISATIPSAIIEFDKYGNAIGISSEKAREFINLQQLILKEKNRAAIAEQEATKKQLELDRESDFAKLNRAKNLLRDAQNNPSMKNMIPSYERAIKQFQMSLGDIEDRLVGINGIMGELTGDNLKKEIDAIKQIDLEKANLIAGETGAQKAAREAAEKKSDADRDKAIRDMEQLHKELQRLGKELDIAAMDPDNQEYARIQQRYEELLARAGENMALIMEVEAVHSKELNNLYRKRAREIRDIVFEGVNIAAEEDKKAKDQKLNREKELTTNIEAELDRRDAADLKAAMKKLGLDPETERAKKEAEARREEGIKASAQATADFITTLANSAQLRDDRKLDAELSAFDKKRAAFDAMLKANRISQSQHSKHIAELDKQEDERKRYYAVKELKRRKAMGISNAIISTAMGVARAFSDYSWPFNFIVGAMVGAAGAIQISNIASEEVPQGRKGLVVQGSSHEQNGIDMIDRGTGRTVANIEGGEPVMVLSKNTYGNNKGLIDELIYNSNYRNGAPVAPRWLTSTPSINPSVIPMMQRGGVANVSSTASSGSGNSNLERLMATMVAQQQQQAQYMAALPTRLRSYVLLQDITDQTDLYEQARRESGIKQD